MLAIFPGPDLYFIIIAKVVLLYPLRMSLFWKDFARATPPASGDTTQGF